MPTYEYRCTSCGHEFEKFQSMTASTLRKCPQCGRSSLRRLIGTGAGVIFRGSGFYETDYRSESYKNAAKKETDSGKKNDTGAKDVKKEDKPKVKKDTASKPKAEPKE